MLSRANDVNERVKELITILKKFFTQCHKIVAQCHNKNLL